MNTIHSQSKTPSNANVSPLADALADDIARSLHEGWKLKQEVAPKPRRPGELLHHFFEYTRAQWPHNVVLSVEGEEVIYSEIDVRSNQLANLLRQRGVASSSRVGICLPRSIDAYIALLAIHKAGGRYVQLNPKFPREQIRHMLNDAKLAAIVTDSELGVREEEVGIPLIFLDRWREADAESSTEQWGHDKPVPDRDVCFIIYSSSTTERPKGVAVEPRMKLQKLRSLVSQQNGFGLQALTLFGRRIEGFLGAA